MHMYLKFKKSTEKLVKAQMTQATEHLKQGWYMTVINNFYHDIKKIKRLLSETTEIARPWPTQPKCNNLHDLTRLPTASILRRSLIPISGAQEIKYNIEERTVEDESVRRYSQEIAISDKDQRTGDRN